MQLLPHQVIGRDFLVSHPRALLADGMRVGKSVQSAAASDDLWWLCEDPDFRVVVVCPASLREQWRRQLNAFCKWSFRRDVYSYEDAVKRAAAIGKERIDVLILDEAHYLKNRKSKRTQTIYGHVDRKDIRYRVPGLVDAAKRVWCLTGTPSPNNASELWPMLHALFPETIKIGLITRFLGEATSIMNHRPLTYWQFIKRFCKITQTPFGDKIEGNKNTDELKKRMAPIMLRRPSSILGNTILPSETLYLDSSKAELERLRTELRKELGSERYTALCSSTAREGALDVIDLAVKQRMGRITGLAKVPALVERLTDEFESGLDKVVIFAWHVDVIHALAGGLDAYNPVCAYGAMGAVQRQGAVDRFQSDPSTRVFIGNIKAAGVGLDLTAANELIFAETSWVPGDNEQASMRITGLNQKRAVRVRYAVLPGSLDERLTEVNRRKMKDIQELVGA